MFENKTVKKIKQKWLFYLICTTIVFLIIRSTVWIFERSVNSHKRQKDFLTWIEQKLNTDAGEIKEIDPRIGFLGDLRLTLRKVDIENPNFLFNGKIFTCDWARFRLPVYATWGILPGTLTGEINKAKIKLEQNNYGEWNSYGLLYHELISDNISFPFGSPHISDWKLEVNNSLLEITKNNIRLTSQINGTVTGKNKRIGAQINETPLYITDTSSEKTWQAELDVDNFKAWLKSSRKFKQELIIPENIELKIKALPLTALAFIIKGIPFKPDSGNISLQMQVKGELDYQQNPELASVKIKGISEKNSLPVFGWSGNIPFNCTYTNTSQKNLYARIGSADFGGTEITMPISSRKSLEPLNIKTSACIIDELIPYFYEKNQWLEWMANNFSETILEATVWKLWDFNGSNLILNLSKSSLGNIINGQTTFAGGKVNIQVNNLQDNSDLSISINDADAEAFNNYLNRYLPESYTGYISSGKVDANVKALLPEIDKTSHWELGLVYKKIEFDSKKSGTIWKNIFNIAEIANSHARNYPDYNPNNKSMLQDYFFNKWEQISLIIKHHSDKQLRIEFVAYDYLYGDVIGWIENNIEDNSLYGEVLLDLSEELLVKINELSPEYAQKIELLALEEGAIQLAFKIDTNGVIQFRKVLAEEIKISENIKR